MAVPKKGVKLIKVNPPFLPVSSLLVLNEDCSLIDFDLKMSLKSEGNDLKISAIYTTLKLIEEYYNHLEKLPSINEIFNDIKVYIELLPTKFYPSEVRRKYDEVRDLLQSGTIKRSLSYIVLEAKKPKALRLYDPKIEEVLVVLCIIFYYFFLIIFFLGLTANEEINGIQRKNWRKKN